MSFTVKQMYISYRKAFTGVNYLQKLACKLFKIQPQVYYTCRWYIEISKANVIWANDVILINGYMYLVTEKDNKFNYYITNYSVLTMIPEVSGEGVRLFSAYSEKK